METINELENIYWFENGGRITEEKLAVEIDNNI
jgi:hypothetical protein